MSITQSLYLSVILLGVLYSLINDLIEGLNTAQHL